MRVLGYLEGRVSSDEMRQRKPHARIARSQFFVRSNMASSITVKLSACGTALNATTASRMRSRITTNAKSLGSLELAILRAPVMPLSHRMRSFMCVFNTLWFLVLKASFSARRALIVRHTRSCRARSNFEKFASCDRDRYMTKCASVSLASTMCL